METLYFSPQSLTKYRLECRGNILIQFVNKLVTFSCFNNYINWYSPFYI